MFWLLLLELPSWHFQAPRAPGIEDRPSSAPPPPPVLPFCSLPLLIHQLGPISFWRKPGGGLGVQRQGTFNIDPCLTSDLMGGAGRDRLSRRQNTHVPPAHTFPASPPSLPAVEGLESRGLKSMDGLGSNPTLLASYLP